MSDLFPFDVIEPTKFDPCDLIEMINEAVAGGYKVICIDSLSHYWMGKGGELEMVDGAAKREKGIGSGRRITSPTAHAAQQWIEFRRDWDEWEAWQATLGKQPGMVS